MHPWCSKIFIGEKISLIFLKSFEPINILGASIRSLRYVSTLVLNQKIPLIYSYELFILSLVTFGILNNDFIPSPDPHGRNGPKYKDMLMQPILIFLIYTNISIVELNAK